MSEAIEAARRIVAWDETGRLADDEWLVERNETAIIGIARALLSSSRVEEVRREALEEAAKVAEEFAESHRAPPCHNDTFWTAMNLAKAIRALSPPVG